MSSFQSFPTESASGPAPAPASAPSFSDAASSRLSPKALALGALCGALAAFVFAPDLSAVIAGDDAGIHAFFVNEAARRRTPPTQAYRPAPAAPRAYVAAPGEHSYARAPLPAPARAYAPLDFREPALDAIRNATHGGFAAPRAKPVRAARKPAPRALSLATTLPAAWTPTATPSSFEPMGKRAVCVRLCDGYHFPLGAVRGPADARAQAGMCESLCPGAPARVYVMQAGSEKIEEAVSLDGRRYDRLPVAFRHASTRDNTCSCRPAGAAADSPVMSLLQDLTMRRGDAVMTTKGVRVFRGATRWPLRQRDFVRVGDTKLSPAARAALATLDRLNARTQRAREAARQAAAARLAPQTL